ncbi:hypothetical protein LSUE1_G005107 [Lachnellula suecica]|uniref:Uncharacterized protein n=1 Tax=Lachnellula suecica TaxID=602035 RepID=A0A8T9C6B1_9HELO|nr:hypothetical protein LSUE1_G005107 [Lachnellula suecica]
MSSVGLNIPKLLPVTGTWAAPFALYHLILSARIVAIRVKSEQGLGDKYTKHASNDVLETDPLLTAVRCHGNFLENVPLAFIFLALAELNGGNKKYLNYVMAAFLAARVAHADGGLMIRGNFAGNGVGRPIGYFGSCGVIAGLSGYVAYLVKGYWGF